MKDIAKKLQAPFRADEYEWRVQSESRAGDKVNVLCYVTARAIMDRLDEVFSPMGWQTSYRTGPDGGVICDLSVYDDKSGQWVHKEDGAENTNIEAVKGGISGALKRAGSAWGIGRLLYKLESNYVPLKDRGKFWHKTKKNEFKYWDAPSLPDWAITGNGEKPKVKSKPTAKSTGKLVDTPKQTFSLTLDAACKKIKMAKPKTMYGAEFLFDSLCNVSGVEEIAEAKKYNMPTSLAEMTKIPEHSGWLVLTELINRIGGELKIYVAAANKAKPEGDNQ
ncbi:MAG: hypothetical protein GY841_04620 [FCB group bacterium]|nr:hypothetical protein [FCB group bacterium]